MCYEELVINSFERVMEKNGISASFYSLKGYKEGASCIIKQNDGWLVFDAERAQKFKTEFFTDFRDACLEVLRRFTFSEEDYDYLRNEFLLVLTSQSINQIITQMNTGSKAPKSPIVAVRRPQNISMRGALLYKTSLLANSSKKSKVAKYKMRRKKRVVMGKKSVKNNKKTSTQLPRITRRFEDM